tara:strand:- start:67509 stop:68498 length:990 start_codon:yes stop_codon:yes gene_type:complete
MARPLRIEYPNAYYHVCNKGELGTTLFPGSKYFEGFLAELGEACLRFHVEVHAYCLLKNEYHLLIKTPEANLSRFMRQLDGIYTQFYQAQKNYQGSIFHSRFKAVLLQSKPYLLEVSRYIHNLPVRTKRDLAPAVSYSWSSLAAYGNKQKAPDWLVRDEVLTMFASLTKDKAARPYAKYLAYVAEGSDADIKHFYARKNLHSVLGDEKFKKSAQSKIAALKLHGKSKVKPVRSRPSMQQVVKEVARFYKVDEKSIYRAARGPGSRNVPRWVAMHLCQELSAVTLQTIANRFGLKRYGTVSTTVGKLKHEFQENPASVKAVQSLTRRLTA